MAVAVCTRESCNEFPIWNGNEHDYAALINGGGGEDRRWRQLYVVVVLSATESFAAMLQWSSSLT